MVKASWFDEGGEYQLVFQINLEEQKIRLQ
jgi:hypothetical protein